MAVPGLVLGCKYIAPPELRKGGQEAALGNGETCLAEGKRGPAVVETRAGRRATARRNSEGAGRYLKCLCNDCLTYTS
jgi:hypothetical protein